jgi:hypothetical protein
MTKLKAERGSEPLGFNQIHLTIAIDIKLAVKNSRRLLRDEKRV